VDSTSLVLDPEIMALVPITTPSLPVVSPGHEAFTTFLAAIDPQFKRGTPDGMRAIEAISLSIEFTNGRSLSFQSRRSKLAKRVDALPAENKRWRAPSAFAAAGAVLVAIIAALMGTGTGGLLSFKSAPTFQATAGHQLASNNSIRPQIALQNGAVAKKSTDYAVTTKNDNVSPRWGQRGEMTEAGRPHLDLGEGGSSIVPHPSSPVSAAMPSLSSSSETIHLNKAQELMREGNVEGAISTLNEAILANGKNAAAYWRRGLAYAYKNQNDSAISDLTRAIEFGKVPPNQLSNLDIFSIHRSRALLYDLKGLYSREISDLTDMINMYWGNPVAAEALNEMWTPPRAKTLIASAYRLRGMAYARISANEKALTDLAFAIELDPEHAATAYNERGQLREKLGDRTRAIADYRSTLALDPNAKGARKSLVRMGFAQ
jgi:tetratricopeptide (TPR) repeat protein